MAICWGRLLSATSLLSNQSHAFLARLYTATTETTSKLVLELLYMGDLKSLRPRRVNLSVLWNYPRARWRISDFSEPPKRRGEEGEYTPIPMIPWGLG